PTSLPIEPTDREDAASRIAGAARFLQHEDPTNPASYLLLRGFRWGELRAQGSDLNPRLLSAPPTQTRSMLKSLLLDGKWAELLSAGESVMAGAHGRGWLDLQRYVLTACDGLGSEYDFVAAAIRGALAALLRDFPALPDLTLMDDTPTANVETRTWLREQGILDEAAAGGESDLADQIEAMHTHRRRPTRSVFDRAMEEVRSGRPERGIELLMQQVDQEKSVRARFLGRSQIADIMVGAGREAVAKPILEELVDLIQAHNLEAWEAGEVVARPLGLLYRCMQREGNSDDGLYLRICRLDPLQAMAFTSGQAADEDRDGDDEEAEASDGDA
ncbi:MAG: type VI secretion system domain-containing protein, partial [Acidobacteriota bacterium]|nr:type VI secretion system domain-containing protein [Acidobacteriota bacterium]